MKNSKVCIKLITVSAMLFLVLIFSGCNFFLENFGSPMRYPLRFSIKNETRSDLSVKLVVGIIPCRNARFEELSLIPDELYKQANPRWSAKLGTTNTIRPGRHGSVSHHIPFYGLTAFDQEKYISFILTISRRDEIVFRVVGWDIPDKDMEKHHINDKMWGFYTTGDENHIDRWGQIRPFPFFTSKFFPDEIGGRAYIGSITYYVRVTPTSAYMEKMDTGSHNLDNQIWRELGRR